MPLPPRKVASALFSQKANGLTPRQRAQFSAHLQEGGYYTFALTIEKCDDGCVTARSEDFPYFITTPRAGHDMFLPCDLSKGILAVMDCNFGVKGTLHFRDTVSGRITNGGDQVHGLDVGGKFEIILIPENCRDHGLKIQPCFMSTTWPISSPKRTAREG